jgi:hypothetical protein
MTAVHLPVLHTTQPWTTQGLQQPPSLSPSLKNQLFRGEATLVRARNVVSSGRTVSQITPRQGSNDGRMRAHDKLRTAHACWKLAAWALEWHPLLVVVVVYVMTNVSGEIR